MTTPETEPITFPYEADARAKIALIRAMAADFALPEPRSLTLSERRIASGTPRAFVEKAANFGAIEPRVREAANANDIGESEAYISAYDPLIDEIEALRQTVRKAVGVRRLRSARGARSIYRVGKSYSRADGGDVARAHIAEMKKALHRRRRTATPETPAPPENPPTTGNHTEL